MLKRRVKELEETVEKMKSQIEHLSSDLKKQDFVINCVGKTYRIDERYTFIGPIYEIEGIETFRLCNKEDYYCFSTSNASYVIETEKVEIDSKYRFVRVLSVKRN